MTSDTIKINTRTAASIFLIALNTHYVYADDTANDISADKDTSMVIEEVIVTAQKREQRIQDVPISIGMVTGEKIAQFGVKTTADLDNFVPGLVIQESPQNLSTITIRGVGTASGNETYDQSVSLFIDGVYAGRQREFQTSLFDIERIEVIKGSQNTLLGKNTSLGAISLITKKPGETMSGFIESSYEFEYGSVGVTGAIDIPAGATSTRISFNHVDENGYVENVATGNDVPHREQDTLRLITLMDLSDNATLEAMYQYDDMSILGDTYQPTKDELGIISALDPLTELSLDQKKSSYVIQGEGGDSIDEQVSERAAITLTAELSDYIISAITGWSDYENDRVIDSDFTAGEYLFTTYDTAFNQFTQEFRLTSPQEGAFDYVVGMFYLQSDYSNVNLIDANFPNEPDFLLHGFPVQGATEKDYEQETTATSIFGHGTWAFTDQLRLTLGLRWTDEDKDAVYGNTHVRFGPAVIVMPAFPPTPLSRNEKALDGSINLQYDFAEDSMAYVSWAKGTKSGGFTDAALLPEMAEYDAEIAKTTELGVKMMFLDGLANLNVAAFYIDIEDFQVVTFTGTSFDIDTVPAASKGIEADGYIVLSESTRLYAGLTYADANQTDIDKQLLHSPKLSYNAGFHYEKPLSSNSGLNWSIDGVFVYRDEMYHRLEEAILSKSSHKIDIRLALMPQVGSWELALVGRNITNERITSYGFEYPLFGAVYGDEQMLCYGLEPMRTISLQARLGFD